jgi:homoserine kinase type II
MAVYTEIGDDELRAFVGLYDLGEVLACKGIAEGVENSNFLLTTEQGNFILTLYEKRVAPEDLPFFIALMDHLAHQGVACPTPVRARDGQALRQLCGRPAAIVTFLNGMWPRRIEPFHCAGLGGALAGLHRAGASFAMRRPNDLGVAGWRRLYEACAPRAASCSKVSPPNSATSSPFSKRHGRRACRLASSMPICFPTMCSSATATYRG